MARYTHPEPCAFPCDHLACAGLRTHDASLARPCVACGHTVRATDRCVWQGGDDYAHVRCPKGDA